MTSQGGSRGRVNIATIASIRVNISITGHHRATASCQLPSHRAGIGLGWPAVTATSKPAGCGGAAVSEREVCLCWRRVGGGGEVKSVCWTVSATNRNWNCCRQPMQSLLPSAAMLSHLINLIIHTMQQGSSSCSSCSIHTRGLGSCLLLHLH